MSLPGLVGAAAIVLAVSAAADAATGKRDVSVGYSAGSELFAVDAR